MAQFQILEYSRACGILGDRQYGDMFVVDFNNDTSAWLGSLPIAQAIEAKNATLASTGDLTNNLKMVGRNHPESFFKWAR